MAALWVFMFGFGLLSEVDETLPAYAAQKHLDYDYSILVQSIFLVHGWGLPMRTGWNAVSWSVSCEWLVYLLFPLFVWFISKLDDKKGFLKGLFVCVFVVGLILGGLSLTFQGQSLVGVIRVVPQFLMGMVVYRLYDLARIREVASRQYAKSFVAVFVALWLCSLTFDLAFLWLIPAFCWFVFSMARGTVVVKILSSRLFVYLGLISYSFYMCHGVVLGFFLTFADPIQFQGSSVIVKLVYIACFTVATLLLSVLVYHYVERPCRKVIVKRFG